MLTILALRTVVLSRKTEHIQGVLKKSLWTETVVPCGAPTDSRFLIVPASASVRVAAASEACLMTSSTTVTEAIEGRASRQPSA